MARPGRAPASPSATARGGLEVVEGGGGQGVRGGEVHLETGERARAALERAAGRDARARETESSCATKG